MNELKQDLLVLQAGNSVKRQQWLLTQSKRAVWALAVLVVAGAAGATWQWLKTENLRAQEAASDQARRRGEHREKLLNEARTITAEVHTAGWVTNALSRIREAARLKSGPDARDLAAATFIGLDADVVWYERVAGTSLAWDRKGKHLLIGGAAPYGTDAASPSRLLDLNGRASLAAPGPLGPAVAAFDPSDTPVLFRWSSTSPGLEGSLTISRPTVDRAGPVGLAAVADVPGLKGWRVEKLACSADGKRVAVAGTASFGRQADKTLQQEMVGVFEVEGHGLVAWTNLNPTTLVLSPDGQLLALGFADGRVSVCTVPGLKQIAEFHPDDNAITSLAFGRNPIRGPGVATGPDWRLAAGDHGAGLQVYDLARHRVVANLRGTGLEITALSFNPDGTLLASGGRYRVRVWDVANEREVLEHAWTAPLSVDLLSALAFSPDGTCLAGTSQKRFAEAYSWVVKLTPHRGIRSLYGLNQWIERVSISEDGRYLAGLSHQWRLGVWDLSDGRLLHVFSGLEGDTPDNAAIEFTPDGRLYLCTGRSVRRWEVTSGRELAPIPLPAGLADSFRLLSNGKLWLLRREARSTEDKQNAWVLRDILAEDPAAVIASQRDVSWRVHDCAITRDGRHLVFTGHAGQSPSDEQVVLVVYDGHTYEEVWRTNRPSLMGDLAIGLSGDEMAVSFARDDKTNVWCSLTNGVQVPAPPVGPPGSSFYVLHLDADAVQLVRRGRPEEVLRLGLGHSPVRLPVITEDGRLMAWGTQRGVVLVADMEAVELRLRGLGYEW